MHVPGMYVVCMCVPHVYAHAPQHTLSSVWCPAEWVQTLKEHTVGCGNRIVTNGEVNASG